MSRTASAAKSFIAFASRDTTVCVCGVLAILSRRVKIRALDARQHPPSDLIHWESTLRGGLFRWGGANTCREPRGERAAKNVKCAVGAIHSLAAARSPQPVWPQPTTPSVGCRDREQRERPRLRRARETQQQGGVRACV